MAAVVALGIGAVSATISAVNSIKAGDAASQTQQQEQQLLNEGQAQANQEQAQSGLIAERTGQENSLNQASSKWTADSTALTGPLGIPAAANAQPKALLGT